MNSGQLTVNSEQWILIRSVPQSPSPPVPQSPSPPISHENPPPPASTDSTGDSSGIEFIVRDNGDCAESTDNNITDWAVVINCDRVGLIV